MKKKEIAEYLQKKIIDAEKVISKKEIAEYIQKAIIDAEEAGQRYADKQDNYGGKYPYAFGYLSARLNELVGILKP